MTDLLEKIHEIITFGVHGHSLDDVVVFVLGLMVWYVIYKIVMYCMGLR